ncbi:acyl-CoA dehydrogenase family protein [Sandaracinus amylolyticus]|uniref:Butyryl-CoA dehydrogenase n=1 Tax=Sandaracinus amylolyticus TaxID=927083 RepID=A0A0F6YHT2_9BACT|nr:acyl-CoA dehydrogenase family protein [Sandaracinus amylolyticus]AKF05088.1 Butyryl-CoA dehydrogenase [Sandaracinus amylolyticus]
MGNFYKDNDDLRWYFEKGLDWDALVRVTEHEFRSPGGPKSTKEAVELYLEIADMVGQFVADEIAPHVARIDREAVIFEKGEARLPDFLQGIFDRIKQMELHGLCVPRELGGMNAPLALYYLTSEIFGRADVSTMAHHGFHGGMALAALMFSIREGTTEVDPTTGEIQKTRFENVIREIARGESWGCMDITEPDAGSDMAQLRAVGEQDEKGDWFVTGQKIFITSGHGKWHFVIARTEKAGAPDDPFAGLKGLSMFLVPTYEDLPDGTRRRVVTLERVEEKLGHHASVTAALSFERAPAMLIGKRGEGFEYMLTLMNGARVGVGFECVGLCEAAIRTAEEYAAQRRSMGKTIDRHEMIADYLEEMRTDVAGIRALCVEGVFHEEMGQKLGLQLKFRGDLSGEERKSIEKRAAKHRRAARRVTPLLKYLGAEKAVEMARRCVQIHGGVGYTTEYGAEKLLRDAMVMPIYEGTSQIQALMAMKDTLGGIIKNPQRFVRRGAQARWRAVSARDGLEKKLARIQAMSHQAQQHLIMRTASDKLRGLGAVLAGGDVPITEWADRFAKNWDPKRDFAFAMLHAERLTRILCDEAIGEILFEQSKKDPARREILERHLERAEPRVRFLLDEITTTGDRLLAKLGHELGASHREAAE